MRVLNRLWRTLRMPLLGLVLALSLCTLLVVLVGESPSLLVEAYQTTLFTSFGLGYTLYYTTPLIFTGLAVAVAFHCGLFNIGGEGQLYVGSIAVVATASLFSGFPTLLAIPIGILAAAMAGGMWGGVAGVLKAYRGSHEVIVTILLNFIGIALVNYVILYPLKNPESQNPETVGIPMSFSIPTLSNVFKPLGLEWFQHTPVNLSLLIAVLMAVACYYFLFYSTPGYELRAVGFNPRASQFAGISVKRNTALALFLSGALAGMVGINEVMGHQHRVILGFSPQYGFTGIAVALLARNHPFGILISAFLFGALQNGAREIEFLSERVTKELSLILQATLISFVAADYWLEKILKQRKQKKVKEGVHDRAHRLVT